MRTHTYKWTLAFCMNIPVFIHIIKTQSAVRTLLCETYYRAHVLGMKIKIVNIVVYFQWLGRLFTLRLACDTSKCNDRYLWVVKYTIFNSENFLKLNTNMTVLQSPDQIVSSYERSTTLSSSEWPFFFFLSFKNSGPLLGMLLLIWTFVQDQIKQFRTPEHLKFEFLCIIGRD